LDCRLHRCFGDVSGHQLPRWPTHILGMQLALVGVSHKTAPVEIRERLPFDSEALRKALATLVGRRDVSEAMILSTCNRVEVVAESTDEQLLREFLCEFHQISPDALSKHLYSFRNADAIRHVFRVAS